MNHIKKGSNRSDSWWQGAVLGASDGRLWNAALRSFPGERWQECWTPFTPLPLQIYLDGKMCYWCSPEGESRRVSLGTRISPADTHTHTHTTPHTHTHVRAHAPAHTHTRTQTLDVAFQAFRLLNHCRQWLKGVRHTWWNTKLSWHFPGRAQDLASLLSISSCQLHQVGINKTQGEQAHFLLSVST